MEITLPDNKYKKYRDQLKPICDIIGIKMAPLEEMITVYPDQFMGMDFSEEKNGGAKNARTKYSIKTQAALIKAFRSHEWKTYSDIYGSNGLTCGGSCKKCGRKFKFPEPSSTVGGHHLWFKDVSDDFILAYHYIYGRREKFGGRITKCNGNKKK